MSNEKWEDIISNSFSTDEASKERVAKEISNLVKERSREIFQSWSEESESGDGDSKPPEES